MKSNAPGIKNLAGSAIVVLSLAGCVPDLTMPALPNFSDLTVSPPSDEDIAQAKRQGRLDDLFIQVENQLKEVPDSKKLKKSHTQIGSLVATDRYQAWSESLESHRNPEGVISTASQNELAEVLQSIKRYSPTVFAQGERLLRQEEMKRAKEEQRLVSQLDAIPADQLDDALRVVDQLAVLTGDNVTYDQLAKRRVLSTVKQADHYVKEGEFEKAGELYLQVKEIDPGFDGLGDKIQAAETAFNVGKTRELMSAGLFDEAFVTAQKLEGSYSNTAELRTVWKDLAKYYQQAAEQSLETSRLALSFDNVRRASYAAERSKSFPYPKRLVRSLSDRLVQLGMEAKARGDLGLALGYFVGTTELQPNYRGISGLIGELKGEISEQAVVKVAIPTFSSPTNAPGLGEVLTSKISQILVGKSNDALRLLERGALDDIVKEQEIMSRADTAPGSQVLASADFLVLGSVMSATVDSSSLPSTHTKRVVVETKQVFNPDYTMWVALPEDQRESLPKPPKMVEQKVYETVKYTVTEQRKLGSVSASFRVINPSTSKLVTTETLVAEKPYEDVSSEGVDLGSFVVPSKAARLPADSHIIRTLLDEQAEKIAAKLYDRFRDPERVYLDEGERLTAEGKYSEASLMKAKAMVILEDKGATTSDLGIDLAKTALVSAG